jgi:leucyl/phenylalanyl-tRNA---protein transferase
VILPGQRLEFPDPRKIKGEPPGLVAVGGDLSVERLLLAYRSGIFPWTANPITWWSPDPRAIFEFDQFHVPRSLEKIIRRCVLQKNVSAVSADQDSAKAAFEITIDQAFRDVMKNCGAGRPDGNWITPEFVAAYTRLHEAGHAHSLECWHDGKLAGGIYGVAIGSFFAGESMFHRESNASKVALYFLTEHLRERGFTLFDIQMLTPVTKQLGAVVISREEYLDRLKSAVAGGSIW